MTDPRLMDAECIHGHIWWDCAECWSRELVVRDQGMTEEHYMAVPTTTAEGLAMDQDGYVLCACGRRAICVRVGGGNPARPLCPLCQADG